MAFQYALVVLLGVCLTTVWAQVPSGDSPCPEVFQYDVTRHEPGKWYGELTLTSDFALSGLWIRVVLDQEAQLLSSTFGDVNTTDSKSFLLKKPDFTLPANHPVKIPFSVKYSVSEAIPRLETVRLNARTVCPVQPSLPVGVSQCPGIFTYDADQKDATDRWYGTLRFNSEYELTGVWIKVILDTPADLVGSQFGDVRSTDNQGFLIYNRDYVLKPGTTLTIPFFVKYSPLSSIPTVKTVRLNARTVCAPFVEENDNQIPKSLKKNAIEPLNSGSQATYPPAAVVDSSFDWLEDPTSFHCGARELTDKIIFGTPTTISMYPWHGAIFHREAYTCGMTLISRRHALTAAHCFYNLLQQRVDPTKMTLRFGVTNLKNLQSHEVQTAQVAELFMHPQYFYHDAKYDIAVLKMDRDLLVTETVKPVCLWEGEESLKPVEFRNGIVTGFGLTERGTNSERLLWTRILVVDRETCRALNPNFYAKYLSINTLCAGNLSRSAVCVGDSGGGLFFERPGTEIWQIRGITSTSRYVDGVRCDNTHYSIFTDVAKFRDWINEQMSK